VRQAASDACDDLLPPTADTFFSYYTRTKPSAADSLQSALHAKATSHQNGAAMKQLKQKSREGDKRPLAHMKAITAQAAWAWKMALPLGPRVRLSDTEYAIAARLNLDLPPFPDMDKMPDYCPLCAHPVTKQPMSLRDDPWHHLVCSAMTHGEGNVRHNEIADVLQHTALLLGAQAKREVKGLAEKSKVRPDLQIFFPGRMLLTDIVVSHPVTTSRVQRHQSSTKTAQLNKRTKYSSVATRLGAELLPFSVATYGGLADDAMKLVQAMGEEGEETMGAWRKEEIIRYTLSAIAATIQRGNARVMLAGRMQSLKAWSKVGN
jgi:phosphoribosyl-ATP pyrophosphohydrolase